MADAAARREARRRKILENSQNRLKLITGESTELNNAVVEQIVNNESSIDSFTHLHANIEEPTVDIDTLFVAKAFPIPSNTVDNEYSRITEQQPSSSDKPTTGTTTSTNCNPHTKRVLIVLLAVILRLLFIFQMQFCVRDSIMYPFIVAEVTTLLLRKDTPERNISPLWFTILILSKFSAEQINRFLRVLEIFNDFVQDFSLYFFSFVAVHLVLSAF